MLSQNLDIFRQGFLLSAIHNKQKNMFSYSPCVFTVDAASPEGPYLLTFPTAEELVTKNNPNLRLLCRVPWTFLKLCLGEAFLK